MFFVLVICVEVSVTNLAIILLSVCFHAVVFSWGFVLKILLCLLIAKIFILLNQPKFTINLFLHVKFKMENIIK